jgi:hypothetical protein
MMGMDQDDIVVAPWTTVKYRVASEAVQSVNQSAEQKLDTTQQVNTLNRLYPGSDRQLYPERSAAQLANTPMPVRFDNVDQILAQVATPEQIPAAMEQANRLLRERHRLQPGELDDFNIRDMAEITRTLSATTAIMSGLLLSVACISLVVGGVGIMNIMLVSVTERTREIGLRMAVGARGGDILRQFLVESIVLCLLGGALGILLGAGRWPCAPCCAGPPRPRCRLLWRPLSYRFWSAWSSGIIRPGKPRGSIRSKLCATSNRSAHLG